MQEQCDSCGSTLEIGQIGACDSCQTDDKKSKADTAYETYDFGEGVTVLECDNWNTEDSADFTRIVYVAYDDDPPDGDSHKVSFHVRFADDGSVDEVYALEVEHGNEIGCPLDSVVPRAAP